MIILQSDNRSLVTNSKYTYLTTNYVLGVNTMTVLNATDSDFAVNAFVLLGNIGTEEAEIMQISTVNATTGVITFTGNTIFAHAESTRVSVLPYNKVRFFWSASNVFSFGTATPLTSYLPIQVSDWFTNYGDGSNSTGFGFYVFYNSQTLIASQPSNPIPYTGYDRGTVEDLLNDFFSLLNNKELKLVTRRDALSWLNEGYTQVVNKLNLTNIEYNASAPQTLITQVGVTEYLLPSDFDHMIAFIGGNSQMPPGAPNNFALHNIEFIPLTLAYSYTGSWPKYYIRGAYMGIIPTPGTQCTFTYIYNARAPKVGQNSDLVNLPNGGYYAIKDWMMYRACLKFSNPAATSYMQTFTNNMNQMTVAAVKRDANMDTWGSMPSSIV